ncbi:hypothetical protein ACIRJM_22635 [Streptomyces sp. NPDC102405]|uniref:hypothetical protein n=1 Tax=Streptomyces sp. NPDC102405 TaxID=3366170 RepID=UPI0038235991
MTRTYRWTAAVSDGKHHDGESAGTVRASSEAEARRLVAEWVQKDGARKKRTWTATSIELR